MKESRSNNNKVPLYPLDHNFYLYLDSDNHEFYKALNQSMYNNHEEKQHLSRISLFKKSYPILIPLVLGFGSFLTNIFQEFTSVILNIVLLILLTVGCIVIFLNFFKTFKAKHRDYVEGLTFIKVSYSTKEILDVVKLEKKQIAKVFLFRSILISLVVMLGVMFIFFSNLLILMLYLMMIGITLYLFVITSTRGYFELRKMLKVKE